MYIYIYYMVAHHLDRKNLTKTTALCGFVISLRRVLAASTCLKIFIAGGTNIVTIQNSLSVVCRWLHKPFLGH